jgi:putative molybdopterin biosynthesis protein
MQEHCVRELLTTEEAADYLRLSRRKLYELAVNGAVPCTRVTGKWLFPRAALDRWLAGGVTDPSVLRRPAPPPIVSGGDDPLLVWALGESGSRLAVLTEGSEAGLTRLARREATIAAIHLHRLDGDDEHANAEVIANARGLDDVVLIAFARREKGLVVAPGNPLAIKDIADVAAKRARFAARQTGSGVMLLLLALLERAGLAYNDLRIVKPVYPTGADIAHAVCTGRADCGIATRAVAQAAGLGFVPLIWERFDFALRQRDYFRPGPQALFRCLRTPAFRERAYALGGYDVSGTGDVQHLTNVERHELGQRRW